MERSPLRHRSWYPVLRGAHQLRLTLGLVLLVGAALAVFGTWMFAELAEEVREGTTQPFDEAVLTRLGALRSEAVSAVMLEVTTLANVLVLGMVTAVAVLFLWLGRHRYSAALLVAAVLGASLLTFALKAGFDRPRPQVIEWGTDVLTQSFPSGHATGAMAGYGTIAYLAARLQRRTWARILTVLGGLLVILAISLSRLMLGVHYPSDVAAGLLVALAWTGFCMALLEGVQRYIRRRVPEERRFEEDSAGTATERVDLAGGRRSALGRG